MKNLISKLKEDRKRILLGVLLFASYMAIMKISSDLGDIYFPKERYMSEDFWNWKPNKSYSIKDFLDWNKTI